MHFVLPTSMNIKRLISLLPETVPSRAREDEGNTRLPGQGKLSSQAPMRRGKASPKREAFTLVELLVVIAIMVIMMGLLVPAFTGIKKAGDATKAAYDIAGLLDQARAYAMANNTYVFVGFAEVDVTVPSSTKPQVSTGPAPYGRVAVAVVASRDGTRGYDITNSNLSTPCWTNYSNGASLVAISKLQYFENVHLAASINGPGVAVPASGGMARPAITDPKYSFVLGDPACQSVTTFDWPLGTAIGAGQYSFKKVIIFDSQGVARIQYSANTNDIAQYMEIGLQQSNGNVVSPVPANQNGPLAAIQIDGMTGATHIYRP